MLCDGQADSERAPLSRPAANLHSPALRLHDLPHEGKTQTRPSVPTGGDLVHAVEPLEDQGERLLWDPHASVSDRDVYFPILVRPRAEGDPPAGVYWMALSRRLRITVRT